jgi:hypothetical protein
MEEEDRHASASLRQDNQERSSTVSLTAKQIAAGTWDYNL